MTEPLARVHSFLNGPSTRTVDTSGLTPESGTLTLPDKKPLDGSLAEALARRRSSYRYSSMSTQDMATLLGWAVGPQRAVRDHRFNMAPSAGGLPSLDIYAIVRDVSGAPAGVHRYDRGEGTLSLMWRGDPTSALRSALVQPEFADRAALVLAVVARLDVTLAKYPIRHYRTLHVDAGIVAQNLYLVAASAGLGCCAVAGFDDAMVTELLGLDETAFPVLLFTAGTFTGSLTGSGSPP
nr:SagB family peptide dehydrogenase [Kibdelosporangium sp. MJ126-NF4]CEL19838.1 TOMM biosynthesis dehydrogenase (protein B) [Kibdelosporangium sp. MJ126-NF4]